jgi:tetratricopeptide (TPR) repeat protein
MKMGCDFDAKTVVNQSRFVYACGGNQKERSMSARKLREWLVVAISVPVLITGCTQSDDRKKIAVLDAAGPGVPKEPPRPVTEAEARAFAKKLESAVANGDKQTVNRLFRREEIVQRALAGFDDEAAVRRISGIAKDPSNDFLTTLVAGAVQSGGSYSLLRVDMRDQRPRAIMRFVNGDGLAYHEIYLDRHADGEVVAHDLYMMATGEFMSHAFRRVYFLGLPEEEWKSEKRLAVLTQDERETFDNLLVMKKMGSCVRTGRYSDAILCYRRLPAKLQSQKYLRMTAITVAALAKDEVEWRLLIEECRRDYPGDLGVDLISIGYLRDTKKWEECLQCIERVDKAIGGDPYLWVQRADVMFEAGRLGQAKLYTEKAIEQDPKMEHGYTMRIQIAIQETNHADALFWLKKFTLQTGAPVDLDAIRANPANASFVASAQFRELEQWCKAQKK